MVEIVKGASISAPKAQQSNSRVNTQSGVSITTGEYIGSKSQAIKQLKSDITSKMNNALKNPVAGAKQLIEADRQRTTIPSKTYDAEYAKQKNLQSDNIPLFDKIKVESAKEKLATGKDLTSDERAMVSKYGINNLLPNTTNGFFDLFAEDNPSNVERFEKIQKIRSKEEKGEALSKEEKDTVETAKLINTFKKSYWADKGALTTDVNQNRANAETLKAMQLYNDTAYNDNEIKVGTKSFKVDEENKLSQLLGKAELAKNRQNLYIDTGLNQYVEGVENTWDALFTDKTAKEIAAKSDSAYSIASAALRSHYTDNHEQFNIMVQDTVTNVANNIVPMIISAATAGIGTAVGVSATAVNVATQITSNLAFAGSCFGNSYKEGASLIENPKDNKVLLYALSTTAAEVTLNLLFEAAVYGGAKMAGYKGPQNITSNLINKISSKFKSPFAKAATHWIGSAFGEFPEEMGQAILSPILQKYILGADVETIFDDFFGQLSSAAYEGFIGFSSGLLMGIGNAQSGFTEAYLQDTGNQYNTIFDKAGIDVNNIAQYFLETTEKGGDLYKAAEKVKNGDKSDIAVGTMMNEALKENKSANNIVYTKIGENVKTKENGISDVISEYTRLVESGFIFPSNVNELYNRVKQYLNAGETISNELAGEFALSVQTYTPRALIMREMVANINTQNSELQSSADNVIINNDNNINIVRGENNGSTDTELLERGRISAVSGGQNRIRKHGANTEIIRGQLGNLHRNKGINDNDVAAGETGWLSERNFKPAQKMGGGLNENFLRSVRGTKSNGYDSIGRKLNEEIQERVSETVFKDQDGTVFSFFHWTPYSFDDFKYGDGAFHCGTLMAALATKQRSEKKVDGTIKEMYVISKKPLILKDNGTFGPYNVGQQLEKFGIISHDEFIKISEMDGFYSDRYDTEACQYVRNLLKSLGYDSYLYQNIKEDTGSWSVGVFDAEQIITVAENGILKENCGVTEAVSADMDADTDYELSDNDMYSKDPSQWSADNKNDTTVSKSLKDKLAGLFGRGAEKKPVSISEIVKLIEKDFAVPISKGKFRQKAYGIYKNKSQAIRTKISNALPTIAHELGHHIDNKYNLRNFESIGEAERVLKETRPDFYNSYKPEARPREAVAEFMRDYLADREMAKEKYPFFFEEFERRLSESGAEGKTDLENLKAIGDKINEYYTAELSERAKAAIISRKEANRINRMGVTLEDILTKVETEMFDDGAAFKKISQEAYDLYYWAKKSSVRAKNTLTGYYMSGFKEEMVKQRDKDGNVLKDKDGNELYVPALKYILADIESGEMLDDFNKYLVSRHGIEWLKQDLRVFADDALNNQKYMRDETARLEKQYPQFKETAEKLYDWYRTFVYEYGVKSGLMTKEQYQNLAEKYPCYVPFMRNVEGQKKGFAKSGMANQNAPIKRAKGSGLEIYDPIESLVIKVEQFMKAADRNAVMQEITDTVDIEGGFGWLLEEVPPDMIPNTISSETVKNAAKKTLTNSGMDEGAADEFSNLIDILIGESITEFKIGYIQGENVVAVRRNGKRTLYQVHDKNLLVALTGLKPDQFGIITRGMGKATRLFKALTTGSNAVWSLVSNAPRDFDSAYKYGSENNPIKYTVDYIKAVASQFGKQDSEIMKLYRTLGGGYNNSFANARELQTTTKELFKQDKNFADKIKSLFHIVDNVTKLADFVETAPRLAEFKRVYERTGDAKKAMLAAEEVTINFNRSGKFAKTFDQYVPYFNASLQGNAKYARALASSFSKNGDRSFLVKSIVTAIIKTGITFGILGLFGDDGEEEYEKLSAYKKNNFYNIYVGGGKFISIPKSQATGVFDSLLERVFEIAMKEDVEWGQEIKDFAGYMWLTFGPPLVDDMIIGSTVLDLAKNEDFTGAPVVSSYYEDLEPEMQYNEKTTYLAKTIGQLFGWSPMKIDHIIESNFGVFGLLNKSLGREEKDWTLGTKTKVLTDSAYSTDVLNNFYDKADDYSSKAKSYPDNAEYVYKDKQYAAVKSIVSALNGYGNEDPGVAREFKILARDYVDKFEKDTEVNKKLLALLDSTGEEDILYDRTFKPSYSIDKVEYKMEPDEFMDFVDEYYEEIEKEYKEILDMNLSDESAVSMLIDAKKNVYNQIVRKYKVKR